MTRAEYLATLADRMSWWRSALESAEGEQEEELRRLYTLICRLLMDYQRCGAEGWQQERQLLDELSSRIDALVGSSNSARLGA